MTNKPDVSVEVAMSEAEKTELLDWVSACQSAYHIDNTPDHRFRGFGSNLAENRKDLVDYVNSLLATHAALLASAAGGGPVLSGPSDDAAFNAAVQYCEANGIEFDPGNLEQLVERILEANTPQPQPVAVQEALTVLRRLERAVDIHLGRSAWTQTKNLKGFAYSEQVRKEIYAAHDDARTLLSAQHAQAVDTREEESDHNKITAALQNYRCANFQDEDGGLPFSDALAAAFGDKDIGRALQEIELIADEIWLTLAASTAPAAPTDQNLIALAEKCSAEVGRHEGEVVWVKFHSRSAIEAFATGVVMSAVVRHHAKQAAPKAEQAASGVEPFYVISKSELLHVMSVAIGASYVSVEDAAKALQLKTILEQDDAPPGWKKTAYGWAQSGESILAEDQVNGTPGADLIEAAAPIIRDYVRTNPKYNWRGETQDPNGAHAWLEQYAARDAQGEAS